jgi:hypothetical protein
LLEIEKLNGEISQYKDTRIKEVDEKVENETKLLMIASKQGISDKLKQYEEELRSEGLNKVNKELRDFKESKLQELEEIIKQERNRRVSEAEVEIRNFTEKEQKKIFDKMSKINKL